MIYYFTGTGNSRYVAEAIAQRTGDELRDGGALLRSGETLRASSDRPWVFVSPIYAWRLPNVWEAFLRGAKLSGSREAYFVITCGSGIGGVQPSLEALCADLGLNFMGAQEVVMPENYIAMFSAPGAEKAARIRAAAKPSIREAAGCIAAGERLPMRKNTALRRVQSGLVWKLFYRYFIHSKPFRVTDQCVSCGKCARECPMHGIELRSGKPVWTGDCTHCMACICGCPAAAIEYGHRTKRKVRYQCPHYGEE